MLSHLTDFPDGVFEVFGVRSIVAFLEEEARGETSHIKGIRVKVGLQAPPRTHDGSGVRFWPL